MTVMIHVRELSKSFTLHNQGGIQLPVLNRVNLQINAGECTVLHGESGAGKSTLLRTLYANYLAGGGDIEIRHHDEMVNLVSANSQTLLAIRRDTLGYVSQFLRVIPRVTTLEVVKQPLKERGIEDAEAEARACELLARLNIPQRLWSLPPGTFSGGEQQRVNIARGFIHNYPILLLDEPTASLDKRNSEVVIELIHEALARNTAIVGIFHDESVREAVADHYFDVKPVPDLPIDNERGAILP
ncbi:phosphonate C-P lyase system protein PhnL [Neptunomonas concharum]|uniref:Phosphonate C-P lyase system protein PhnL n=1 Tax=Neptunomonas concharum TaxID=1031538 RepID=A0A5P1RBU6_9GAMM|nr:phosphonate C-P lyase system protein PhnL [Neptunomonas concharum]QEQ97067.1 phosphonate C-P lyase system protein PhnL [Neptunomonas concharum]